MGMMRRPSSLESHCGVLREPYSELGSNHNNEIQFLYYHVLLI